MKSNFIEIDGFSTHYFDEGSGPVVVLMHGAALGIDAEFTWFRQIESLRDRYRVIAFDQPGFGRSAIPDDGFMGRARRADHAIAFLRKLGVGPALMIGHSEGGYIASRIAITAPELISGMIVVTSGSTAPMLGGTADDAWMAASTETYTVGAVDEEGYIEGLKAAAFHWDRRMEDLARASFRRGLETGHVRLMQDLPESELDMRLYMKVQQETIQPHIANIRIPALLVWAADDKTVPVERGVALMRALPGVDFVALTATAHNVMHDRHETFDAIVARWLAERAGSIVNAPDN